MEPKLLIIYLIDAEGKRDPSFQPIIDGTLEEADELIALVLGYLRLMGAKEALELIVIGDGARWIWERIPAIIDAVGIDPKHVTAIVDSSHAVEHLQKVTDLKTQWSEPQRKRWLNKHRTMLRQGKIHDVIASIESLCHGRHAKAIQTEFKYFQKKKLAHEVCLVSAAPFTSGQRGGGKLHPSRRESSDEGSMYLLAQGEHRGIPPSTRPVQIRTLGCLFHANA